MELDSLPNHIVYSPSVIEFVTVTAETCILIEHAAESSKTDFIYKAIRILPLLYLKANMISKPEAMYEDSTERFVTEEDYQYVREQMIHLLGNDDSFLEVFHPDIALSDTPIVAFISENLADIYQELKDFVANYQLADTEIMNDALASCLHSFGEHWGQKLLNTLKALHAIQFNEDAEIEEDVATFPSRNSRVERDSFLHFQQEDEDDTLNKLL
jgi:hypothetical protein